MMVTLDDKTINDILERVKTLLERIRDSKVDNYTISIESDDGSFVMINGECEYKYGIITMR